MWNPLTSGINPSIVWISVSFQPNGVLWLTASSKLSSTAELARTRQLRTRVLVGGWVYYASSMFALTRRWGIPQHNLIMVYSRHTHTWSCTTVTQVQYRVFEAHWCVVLHIRFSLIHLLSSWQLTIQVILPGKDAKKRSHYCETPFFSINSIANGVTCLLKT